MTEISAETAAVRDGEAFDQLRLEAYLRERIEDLPDAPMVVLQFPRGLANLTYRLAFGDLMLVLRRPPFGKIAPGAHDMAREHTILSRLWRAYPRAPRAFLLCDDESVLGAPFVVQEYRAGGVVIFDGAPPAMAGLPNLGERLTVALADALADLHRVDFAAVGLSDLGRPEGFVERQLAGWRDRWIRVSQSECAATMEQVGERLARELPASARPAIVHNDWKLDNCQFAPDDPDHVVSVFDWDMATLGDPLIDVGLTLAYWSHMRREPSLGLPPKEAFAAAYAERMEIDVTALRWYEAFACWRNAVAVQQLYDRYRKGDSHDDRLAETGRTVARLADRAAGVLEGAS